MFTRWSVLGEIRKMSQMRREGRPDAILVISESEESINDENRHSAMPLLIHYPSNKANQNMEQIKMQFHKK